MDHQDREHQDERRDLVKEASGATARAWNGVVGASMASGARTRTRTHRPVTSTALVGGHNIDPLCLLLPR